MVELSNALNQVHKLQEQNILFNIRQRKEVFENRINTISTKEPFSYAFKKENNNASIMNIGATKDEITTHFEKMFNTKLDNTDIREQVQQFNKLKEWKLELFTVKKLVHTTSSMKNAMAGWDNIPIKFFIPKV